MEKSLIPKGVFALRKEQANKQNRSFLPQIQAARRHFSALPGSLWTYPPFCTHFVDKVVSKAKGSMVSLCL
jgi:hypothetical protein